MRRTAPIAVLVAALALAIGGCFGSDGGDVNSLLKQTFAGGQHVRSGKLNVTLEVTPKNSGASKPVKLQLTGPFISLGRGKLPHFDFTLALVTGGGGFKAGAISTGSRGFIRLQDRIFVVAPDVYGQFQRGFQIASKQPNGTNTNPSFHSLGIDPRSWLKNSKVVGEEDVGGVTTKHISADLDVNKLIQDIDKLLARASRLGLSQRGIPSTITPTQQENFAKAVKNPKFEVWTGKDDKILRRMRLSLSFELPAATAGGLRAGDVALTFELDNVNHPQKIATPAGARPFSELASALRAIAGQISALGGGPPSVPSSGGGSGSALSSYSRCLQAAGSDLRKAQSCARLLGP